MGKIKEYKTMIPIPVYGYRIYIIFSEDIIQSFENLKKKLKLNITWEPEVSTEAFHYKIHNEPTAYIFFKPTCKIHELVHESFHAIFRLMKWIGAEIEEEVFAYTLGYFLELLTNDNEKAKKFFEENKQ